MGYDHLESQVKLRKYRQVTSSKAGTRYQIVLDQTPFYPEGGGQVGDTGYLEGPDGARTPVLDTRKENNEILHITEALPEDPGAKFLAVVDAERRKQTRRNHTATHLLHQALREVLGSHVEQKGSAVQPGYLRFDFSHFSKLKDEELRRVEDFVNERIADGLDVEIKQGVPMQEALEAGAMALFGEKYGDTVRTVRFGDSIELCGGTHADNTAEIWHFKILSESAVAAGVRRIEAITSDAVREYFADKERVLEAIRTRLKNAQDPLQAVESLQEENAGLKKELERLKREQAGNLKGDLKSALDKRDGVHFLARQVDLDASSMKDLAFQLGGEVEDLFLLLGSEQDGKALLTLYISKGLAAEKDLNAGAIIRELGKHIQGGGGGQPFFATAGGKNPSGIGKALEAAASYLQ